MTEQSPGGQPGPGPLLSWEPGPGEPRKARPDFSELALRPEDLLAAGSVPGTPFIEFHSYPGEVSTRRSRMGLCGAAGTVLNKTPVHDVDSDGGLHGVEDQAGCRKGIMGRQMDRSPTLLSLRPSPRLRLRTCDAP